jgi:hypothetical protein
MVLKKMIIFLPLSLLCSSILIVYSLNLPTFWSKPLYILGINNGLSHLNFTSSGLLVFVTTNNDKERSIKLQTQYFHNNVEMSDCK